MHRLAATAAVLGLLPFVVSTSAAQSAPQTLLATPSTVAWGYYSGSAKPALTVHSGDTVAMQTLSTCGNVDALKRDGVPEDQIPTYVKPIYDEVKDKGPGGHILTGPVAIEGAEIGDVLEVQVVKINIDTPWACNHFRPGAGFLQDDFPYSGDKIIPLDRDKMIGHFAPNIDIPLHPFFGSMGVAPGRMRINSAPPWMHGGNMDNKDLVAGTTIFYPVLSKGALFEAGDGHAGQGDGEVDITALETNLTGTFRFIVHKDMHLRWPRAETPTSYIAMGFSPDLKTAAEMATRNMIKFLVENKHMTEADAYMLISVACNLSITQLVDTNDGVHVTCAKSLFK